MCFVCGWQSVTIDNMSKKLDCTLLPDLTVNTAVIQNIMTTHR